MNYIKYLFAILTCFSCLIDNAIAADTRKLEVHFIDSVQSTDAILIDFGTTEILIDASHNNAGIAKYLENYVDGALEVLVLTHPHEDHVGGMREVLEKFEVKEIWINGDERKLSKKIKESAPKVLTKYEETNAEFIKLAIKEKAKIHIAQKGDKIEIDNLSFDVLYPIREYKDGIFDNIQEAYQEMNNNSIVLRLEYNNTSFLFTGDILEETEKYLLSENIQADILKTSHHGSNLGSSKAFIEKVAPSIAISMTKGDEKKYGKEKPHTDIVQRFESMGIKHYTTGIDGTIIITVDANGMQLTNKK